MTVPGGPDLREHVQILTEQLHESNARLAAVSAQNERLAVTMREARDQIVMLKEEVDRLAQPPSGAGIFLGARDDGTAEVFTGGRKMLVCVSPAVDLASLRPGQALILNEALNVVAAQGYETLGEIVTLKGILPGERALVISRADEERVVQLAEPLRNARLRPGDALLSVPQSGYVYERVRADFDNVITEEIPDVRYADIGGLGPEIEQLRTAVELPLLRPDLFERLGVAPSRGILLYGPPGCGKTLLARAVGRSVAAQLRHSSFMQVKVPGLLNKYVGETERSIRLVFQRARALSGNGAPVIIFFDEMDVFSRVSETGGANPTSTYIAQLLSEIDELEALSNIIVIGTSNRTDAIDPALLRPGRFETQIYVGRPDRSAALEIVGKYLSPSLPFAAAVDGDSAARYREGIINSLVDVIFDNTATAMGLAEATFESGHRERVGFPQFLSGAALRDIADHAKRRAMKRALHGGDLAIEGSDLHEALRTVIDQVRRLFNATRPDDWAQISGARGERIAFIRTFPVDAQPERLIVPDIARPLRSAL